ncbi:MAG TPA: glycine cleavage system aminomethyltransferase GcvT [Gemmatimonadales bacterium]|jgi:aminomethyltransferase|nr:glycine cleavage system aminomethyltransferase GcvT [Gemmatimonadales bacterium]
MSEALKRTSLYDRHVAAGGKMVPFGGWEMPVQYRDGIIAEHRKVREDWGMFDCSHMGEFEITGPDRNALANRLLTNDVGALKPWEVQYSALLTEQGTFVDDCTVYRMEDRVMIVVNAANIAKDWAHVTALKGGANVRLRDASDETGLIAVQGPASEKKLQALASVPLANIPYYAFITGKVAGVQCFISRTGYTGEDGFELYCRSSDAPALWDALAAAGCPPCGLGARDSLRLEVAYPLYGNDIDDTITPLEAGLGWIVKMEKGAPFTGLEALKQQQLGGITRKLVGFKLLERGIPRHGMPVHIGGRAFDIVRSGCMSPSTGEPIGLTYLPADQAKVGTKFEVEIRGAMVPAEVVKRPFWTKGSVKRK